MAGWDVRPDRTEVSTYRIVGKRMRHTINGNINDIGAGFGTGKHTTHGDTGGIVRVNVDGQVRVSLSDSPDQPIISNGMQCLSIGDVHSCSLWLEETSHVLDTKHMDTFTNKLISEIKVVL